MAIGDIKKIELTRSSFKDIISNRNFYIDKTKMIENFLTSSNSVHLVARQRRLGKTLNMDTLRCFLTDKEDLRYLFKGLYIEKSPVWEMANSAPVFYFDFKTLSHGDYRRQIVMQVYKNMSMYIELADLKGYHKIQFENLVNNPDKGENALLILTEIMYDVIGKRSYLLIDEYDQLLMHNYDKESYEEIRGFITHLFSSAVKSNQYLEKALLTGVMRISHESMFSGLNNIITYDVFNDDVYTNDYGFTEEEIAEISKLTEFDISELRQWYNGVRIFGVPIYNTFSVMSFLLRKRYDCYWGKSGTMDMIRNLLDDSRLAVLAKLLAGEQGEVSIVDRVSLCQLVKGVGNQAFYSLLVQAGYFALGEKVPGKFQTHYVSIPNTELMRVWKDFILESLYPDTHWIKTLFDNIRNLKVFADDLEYFLSNRLSYHDLSAGDEEEPRRLNERFYHIFMLGFLSAYEDTRCRFPQSNKESGDGRYDILAERPKENVIFELKACKQEEDLELIAEKALTQITSKRYGEDLDKTKKLIKVGIAFHKKKVRVKVSTE